MCDGRPPQILLEANANKVFGRILALCGVHRSFPAASDATPSRRARGAVIECFLPTGATACRTSRD